MVLEYFPETLNIFCCYRESDGEEDLQRTAQYLARNVILYTHYVGEVSRIVDEHFSKALDQTTYSEHKGKTGNIIKRM